MWLLSPECTEGGDPCSINCVVCCGGEGDCVCDPVGDPCCIRWVVISSVGDASGCGEKCGCLGVLSGDGKNLKSWDDFGER